MMKKKVGPLRKRHVLLKILNDSFYDLPCPVNLNVWWSFGSMLGLCLVIQFVSGLLLSVHYTAHEDMAFDSVIHIMRNVKKGWMLRSIHANGASMFFMCIYVHIARGIYYGSYLDVPVWNIGVLLYFMVMAEAFLGYALPWGQMSYWGATVVTNMLTVIPLFGEKLCYYMWGGWTVCNATLQRFYTLHFMLPFLMVCVAVLHLFYLHENGSNNPLGIESDTMCIPFHPFYTVKDLFGFVCFSWVFMYLVCVEPELLGNVHNYTPADSMKTPLDVQPEWYFVFAYSILRSIPHKVGGVVAMGGAIAVLLVIPVMHTGEFRSLCFYPFNQMLFWCLIGSFIGLTWAGSRPAREPFISMGLWFSCSYYVCIILNPLSMWMWDYLLKVGTKSNKRCM
uniref:Cytochrome b n=1 Tax=Gregariella coralliophaga TaxID=2590089 RepID=A0A516EZG5_9BIVA|nr:cytochrome b [Gregariella coralliophaga]QDO71894.1 cytochrome b [Gregariella coralliophaga]